MPFNNTDIAAFKDVWVFCEQRQGKLMPTDFELISEGRKLADELGVDLCGLLLGDKVEGLAKELGGYGADKVYVCEKPHAEELHHRRLHHRHLPGDRGAEARGHAVRRQQHRPGPGSPLRRPSAHRPVRRLHAPGRGYAHLQGLPARGVHPCPREDRQHQHRHGPGREARRVPRPEDDPSRFSAVI
jgi:Electron transfer flavoprotein, alpha subunit